MNFRHALRVLAQNPGFTAVAVATLALGIGANTAIFTVANTLLLRPLPYKDPASLMRIATDRDITKTTYVSFPFLTQFAEHNRSFSGVAAYQYELFNLSGRGDTEQIMSERVSGNFFDVLGVQPIIGRAFLPEEDAPGGKQVVLISYELWMRIFNGDRNAVGQSLSLDSKDYTVIGVLPPKFGVPLLGRHTDIWAPHLRELSMVTPARVNFGGMYYECIGRLRPGVSAQQAQAETELIYRQYKQDKPGNFDSTVNVVMSVSDLQSRLVANVRSTVLILSAAVGFVLLIACANVAGLLLSRSLGRRKEFAVRTALGASRSALIRQMLTESVVLAILAGILGVALGLSGTRVLATFSRSNLPQIADVPFDFRVLAFTLAISLLSGILFGLVPSLQLSRPDLNTVLRDEGRGTSAGRGRNRARSLLVIAQVALSVILLIGSGLLIRSFVRLRTAAPGFDPKNVLTVQTFLPPVNYTTQSKMIAFYNDALDQLRTIPGVESAMISTALPVVATHGTPALFEGQPAIELGRRPVVLIESISPDYNKVLRISLTSGRAFTPHDDAEAPKVVVVNQTAVRSFWPNENPLGKRVWIGNLREPFEVVGVFGDTKNNSLAEPAQSEVFLPYPQLASPLLYVNVRTASDPLTFVAALRAKVAAADRDQPITDIHTMDERLESSAAQARSMTLLLGVFSAAALTLAIVGIYGIISYTVAQRTQELGIRIALGASNREILTLVVGNGLWLAGIGAGIGMAGSAALTRLMASLLYQTSPTDPLIFISSAVLFISVAAAASFLPARRATKIDPACALRAE